MGFPSGSTVKESACNAGDSGSVPGLGRSPGEGHGNPLQYSFPMNRGAWTIIVHRVTKAKIRTPNVLKRLKRHRKQAYGYQKGKQGRDKLGS